MIVRRFFLCLLCVSFFSMACNAQPVTDGVTLETISLLSWLSIADGKVAIGGQHIANQSGWSEQQKISGFSPLVFGIEYRDFAGMENDPAYWEWSRKQTIKIFQNGGIVTIVDHMPNFVSGGKSFDKNPDLPAGLLPGGSHHQEYKNYLDRFALFAKNTSVKGVSVPIIYRPFHEMNGSWFWWGKSSRFVELWKFTFSYLTNTKGVNNLLWAWSPNIEVWDVDRMSNYWPGKEYVDIVGLDGYSNGEAGSFSEPAFRLSYTAAVSIADSAGKPFAWTETGFEKIGCSQADFWTNGFLNSLKIYYPKAKYALIWNGKWGPQGPCPSSSSFNDLMGNTKINVLGRVSPVSIYGNGYKAVVQ